MENAFNCTLLSGDFAIGAVLSLHQYPDPIKGTVLCLKTQQGENEYDIRALFCSQSLERDGSVRLEIQSPDRTMRFRMKKEEATIISDAIKQKSICHDKNNDMDNIDALMNCVWPLPGRFESWY